MTREDAIFAMEHYKLHFALTRKAIEAFDMAIKALEQEPCTDAISRQAAIYAIKHAQVNFSVESEIDFTKHEREVHEIIENVLGAQEKALKGLPPVNPAEKVGRWIPVSERLPKIATVYRVTRCYSENGMNPRYLVDACFFDGSNTWYNDNRINHERAYADNVIAWQENPEPYKASPTEAESEG